MAFAATRRRKIAILSLTIAQPWSRPRPGLSVNGQQVAAHDGTATICASAPAPLSALMGTVRSRGRVLVRRHLTSLSTLAPSETPT